MKDLKGKL
jgi:hypothetical protein